MPSVVLRLWVLVLAVLLQAGSWRSESYSSASVAALPSPALGDFDAAEDDVSEELSALDDSFGSDLLASSVPDGCTAPQSCGAGAWVDGLPPGGPPLDAPFKPPRA